jgi:predicted HNH restriction endonuclease
MIDRIPEKALIIPSLLIMQEKKGRTTTSELIEEIPKIISIEGEDLAILSGRNDNKFSQKVRNLKSHNTLEELGFAEYKNGTYEITKKGTTALSDSMDSLLYLIGNNFDSKNSLDALANLAEHKKEMEIFDEDSFFEEGEVVYISLKKMKRSSKLRVSAIEYYADTRGNISCDICSFNFESVYGTPAKGYIEMHHIKPIYMYKDGDIGQTIDAAIKNLRPVCANCHKVIHRTRPPYGIEDVKGFYQNNLAL